jgi:hypothetical protein
MTTAIQQPTLSPDIIASIVLKGDISALKPEEKVAYYRSVCERVGLDPATQPFQLLTLQGKQILYASKSATEQLSKVHGVSHEVRDRQTVDSVFVVYVRASLPGGRFTDASGAVNIGGAKGDVLANALMKAETKAKRRATLSLLGLGMMDETEVETVPGAVPIPLPTAEVPKVPEPHPVEAAVEEHLGGEKVDTQPEPKKPAGKVSPADAKKLDALRRKLALTNKVVTEWMSRRYGADRLSVLSREQFDELYERILPGIAKGTIPPIDATKWPESLVCDQAGGRAA